MDSKRWGRVLAAFQEESGEPPSDALEAWELLCLAKLSAKALKLKGPPARQLSRLLLPLEGKGIAACLSTLQQRFPAGEAAAEAVAAEVQQLLEEKRGRSRSQRRAALREARGRLRSCEGGKGLAKAAKALLREGRELEGEAQGEGPKGLAAPACFGCPAFFPVGNAAGRFKPVSAGLDVAEPRLLFIGLSDPRHLLAALAAVPSARKAHCTLNDLNAETCARNALLLSLMSAQGDRSQRLLVAFSLWWSHELPATALPLLNRTAAQVADGGLVCAETAAVLRRWAGSWAGESTKEESEDIKEVFAIAELPSEDYKSAAQALVKGGVVANETLRYPLARLDYGLYRERKPPDGWEAAGDGVFLWPEVPPEREFETDQGQPQRLEYLATLAWNLPRFLKEVEGISAEWLERKGRLRWRCLAGDCLAAGFEGSFHRVFTSNVADHVGVPALALALGAQVEGRLCVSLSNNLRALDSQGDAKSLLQKVHGISAEDVVAACGMRLAAAEEPDQLLLEPCKGERKALQTWPAECAKRLYRCPAADKETVAKRRAQGEPLGFALRYARRFTVSPVTVACIARLLQEGCRMLSEEEAAAAAGEAKKAMAHSQLRLAQCLDWSALPGSVRAALAPEVQPRPWRDISFEVAREAIADWAWRTHPPVVVLWVRASGLAAAEAAGVVLAPAEPVWGRCRNPRQLAFLEAGVWGPLRWALEAQAEDVQVIDGPRLSLQASGALKVEFALPEAEVEFAVGAVAFVLSLVDNAVVSGPHSVA